MVFSYQDREELTCLRAALSRDIQDYKENYVLSYSRAVATYLQSASQCDAGNGDSTIAVRTLLPYSVSLVARFEFGFALPFGGSLVGRSLFIHGYGSVDPSITGNETAVEFFDTSVQK